MSADKFEAHPVHESLAGLGQSLNSDDVKLTDSSIQDQLDQIKAAFYYTRRRLELANPFLTNVKILNNLQKHIDAAKGELDNFLANGNTTHLNNAIGSVDSITGQTRNLIVYGLDDESGASLSAELNTFRNSAHELIRDLREKRGGLYESIKELATKMELIDKNIEELRDSMNKRVQQFDAAADQQQERIDGIASDFQSQFSNAESTRLQESSKQLAQQREKFDELMEEAANNKNKVIADIKKTVQKLVLETEDSAQGIIDGLKAKQNEASDLVQVIGNIGVTGNYRQIANDEQKAANIFRWIALAFMGLTVFVVLTIVYGTVGPGEFDWRQALFRLGVATILLVPAWYAGKESMTHRAAAYRNRQAELELASIDPFLERMPEDKRNELKGNLTEKLFGNKVAEDKERDAVTAGPLYDLLKMVLKNLTQK